MTINIISMQPVMRRAVLMDGFFVRIHERRLKNELSKLLCKGDHALCVDGHPSCLAR